MHRNSMENMHTDGWVWKVKHEGEYKKSKKEIMICTIFYFEWL